ncbi:MAG TPA: hypothetical protein VGC37_11210 [Friedmanniella sp.]
MASQHEVGSAAGPARVDRVLLRRGNLVVSQSRATLVATIVVLLVLGAVLPYVTLSYLDDASKPAVGHPRLFGAASLLGGVDPTYLPGYQQSIRSAYNLALNFAAAGPGLQQIGSVVAVLTGWALLTEEINRIAWWFLHLSAYPLLVAPVPLLIGAHQLHGLGVGVSVGPGWVPGVLAGVLVWLASWRARSRIDTYGSF